MDLLHDHDKPEHGKQNPYRPPVSPMDFPDIDDNLAGRYRLCQIGFALSGLSLGLLSFSSAAELGVFFSGQRNLFAIFQHPIWQWGVSAPITIGSFVGSYLLWGRWRDHSWQRRVGLLVLMNGIDLLLWGYRNLMQQPELLQGQNRAVVEHAWLQHLVTGGMGWAELMLFAGLAADVSAQLGSPQARSTGRTIQAICGIGLLLWGMESLTQTNWDRWPLVQNPLTVPALVMILLLMFLTALASFQVTTLCMAAARQCRRYVRELQHDDSHELLSSRSDDPDWGQDRDRW